MDDDIRALTEIRHQQALHFRRADKFHADDLQYDLIIGVRLAHPFLYGQRLSNGSIGRNNLVKIPNLHHRRAIDLQDGLENREQIRAPQIPGSVDVDRAFHRGIDDVVEA